MPFSEFSISPEALDALSSFVNTHGALYDQGLAFGGVNGVAVKHIHGDGYWNQVRVQTIVAFSMFTNIHTHVNNTEICRQILGL